jgi:hypothetical protein
MAKAAADFYGYDVSLAAAIATVIVFAILSALHLFRLFKTRTWFCIPFTIGALCKTTLPPHHFIIVELSGP